jgi:hypothetical protein
MGQKRTPHAAVERPPGVLVENGSGRSQWTETPPLVDAEGPIPTFVPRQFDEHGRLIPLSDEERQARARAAVRALEALDRLPDDDPPGTDEAVLRGIDAHRPPGCKLFE